MLSRAPQLFDRDKISAVEKFVTHVDELPARYQAAQIVFLSKNSLTGTSGIVQFAAVRVLSLADNLLSDVDEVRGYVCVLLNSITATIGFATLPRAKHTGSGRRHWMIFPRCHAWRFSAWTATHSPRSHSTGTDYCSIACFGAAQTMTCHRPHWHLSGLDVPVNPDA